MEKVIMGEGTFRLFKYRHSFVDGVASLLDCSSNAPRYNYDATDEDADMHALQSDWWTVGGDLQNAIKKYEQGRR